MSFLNFCQRAELDSLRQELVDDPALRQHLLDGDKCPSCGRETYTLRKDHCPAWDQYDEERWWVYINQNCQWSGHYERVYGKAPV